MTAASTPSTRVGAEATRAGGPPLRKRLGRLVDRWSLIAYTGLAVIYLQIAILLSSIAALLKKPFIYWVGLAVGVVGLVYFANGFFLFF